MARTMPRASPTTCGAGSDGLGPATGAEAILAAGDGVAEIYEAVVEALGVRLDDSVEVGSMDDTAEARMVDRRLEPSVMECDLAGMGWIVGCVRCVDFGGGTVTKTVTVVRVTAIFLLDLRRFDVAYCSFGAFRSVLTEFNLSCWSARIKVYYNNCIDCTCGRAEEEAAADLCKRRRYAHEIVMRGA